MSGRDPVYKILKVVWKFGLLHGNGRLCIVAIEADIIEQWKAYIGYIASPTSEDIDARRVVEWGARLDKSEAMGFFPGFDPDKFTT